MSASWLFLMNYPQQITPAFFVKFIFILGQIKITNALKGPTVAERIVETYLETVNIRVSLHSVCTS